MTMTNQEHAQDVALAVRSALAVFAPNLAQEAAAQVAQAAAHEALSALASVRADGYLAGVRTQAEAAQVAHAEDAEFDAAWDLVAAH